MEKKNSINVQLLSLEANQLPHLSEVYEVLEVLWLYQVQGLGEWTIKTDLCVAGLWFLVQFGGDYDSYIIYMYIGLFQWSGG